MLKRLLAVCILVIAAVLALLIGNSISAAQDPLDKFTYLPIIFKEGGPNTPWHSLSISQMAWPNPVQAGGLLTYTLRYTVTGTEPATGLTLVDAIPPTTTYQSCAGGVTCLNQAGRVTWPLGQVLPATSGVLTMVLRVGEAVISGTRLYNTAALTDTSNRLVTHTLPVVVQTTHSLSVTQTGWPSLVQAEGLLTYTINIYYTVTGTEPAPGLTLVDVIPLSMTFQTCDGGVSCSQADGRVSWSLGDVPPATTGVVTLALWVDSGIISGTTLYNTVTLTDTTGLTASHTSRLLFQPPLDVVVVFDASGSMQYDTNCHGCYEPYGDGGVAWTALNIPYAYPNPAYVNRIPIGHLPTTYLDGTANVTGTNNLGGLCWDRDSNQPAYYTIAGTPTRYYVVIEGELYSLNSSVLTGPLRQPGRGYWAVQNANYRVIYRMMGDNGDPDNTFATGATPIWDTGGYRSSWVSHMPYVSWAIEDVVPFGHDYTLAEARANPNDVPSLEYDFITKSDWDTPANPDDTRIWVRVQGNGWYADTLNLYWAVYRYSDLYAPGVDGDPTKTTPLGTGQIEQLNSFNLPKKGSGYGGADGNFWSWRSLTFGSGLNLDNGQRYALKIWAGGPGVGIDQIVIGNQNDTDFTTNADGGSTTLKATAGSAFRQACNHCNPIYGLTISNTAECLTPKDNGANTVPANNYDLANPQHNPLYSGYQPLQGAKEAVKHFISRLNPQFDQAGLVTYSTDTPSQGQVVELRCLRHESAETCYLGTSPITYTQMLTALERVPPYGSTNMANGMRKGLEVLGVNVHNVYGFDDTCIDDTDHCSRGGAARRVMILMTDGVANINPGGECSFSAYASLYPPTNWTGNTEDIAKDCVIYYAQKARLNDVTLYAIGMGNGVDVDLMQQAATEGGGQYFAAPSTDQLDAVVEAIWQAIR